MPIGPAPRISSFQPTLEPKVLQAEDFGLNLQLSVDQNYPAVNEAQKNDKPIFIVFDVVLATAGNSQTCYCESDIPEWWMIAVRPVASAKVSLFLGPNNSGTPIRLSGGGIAKIPGMSNYLTVLNEASSVGCVVTVIAIRGYNDVIVQGGQVQ